MRVRHLRLPAAHGLVSMFLAVRFEECGVDRLLVAPCRLGLVRQMKRELTEASREAWRTETVLPGAAHSSIHTSERAHNDPEALSNERVGSLPVLRDERRVVALLARILTLSLQADPLADPRSDDHLEALPGR